MVRLYGPKHLPNESNVMFLFSPHVLRSPLNIYPTTQRATPQVSGVFFFFAIFLMMFCNTRNSPDTHIVTDEPEYRPDFLK